MSKILLGIFGLLAFTAAPLAAHAELPGEICADNVQVGTTKMADDRQNIIACLETGEKAQNGKEIKEWKAMTSSGGGGVTGGCLAWFSYTQPPTGLNVRGSWGKGCSDKTIPFKTTPNSNGVWGDNYEFCKNAQDSGYSCGVVSLFGNSVGGISCMCSKK